MALSILNQGAFQGIAAQALVAASARLSGVISSSVSRSCTTKALPAGPMSGAQQHGNVYPNLTEQQLAAMKHRRTTSNCAAQQLSHKQVDAHQTKHIMICTGKNCGPACRSCGTCGGQLGHRVWEYLQKRLKEINQLRSENDQEEPILGSCIDCDQVQALLPALATTEHCRGPIAVVYPEGVWYERLSPLVLERVIEEHLLGGHVVTGHVMMGSQPFGHHDHCVLPALDITRRATPNGHWAQAYAW